MRKVEAEIWREARRQILRYEARLRLRAEDQTRIDDRSRSGFQLPAVEQPEPWQVHPGFDPYRTRARKKQIGHSVQAALEQREYCPRHPLPHFVARPDGKMREVAIYQVADSAVSKMVYESLSRKNAPIMSARSYAYRRDLTVQDAIRHIRLAFRDRSRLFIAEYDFSKFFDRIAHDHVLHNLGQYFYVTEVEHAVVRAFLRTGSSTANNYTPSGGPARLVGIPQGTSVSLFLANAAAWQLDRALEDHGVGFVRYADDTLLWSSDYGRLVSAVEQLHDHAQSMGVEISPEKSKGIRLLLPELAKGGELLHTTSVEYLGYSLGLKSARLKEDNEKKIRHRIEQLVFNTLLREPQAGTQKRERIGVVLDHDYAMVIARLRRYLYGDLSEREVRRYQAQGAPLRRFRGAMAAYPLLDNTAELRSLDNWILSCLWLAVKKRGSLLKKAGVAPLPAPHGLTRPQLRRLRLKLTQDGETIDLRPPSVLRIAAVVDVSGRRTF